MKVTARGSLWWRAPNPRICRVDYSSAEALRDAWRALIATPPVPPRPAQERAAVVTQPAPQTYEQQYPVVFYADPAHVVPQTVSWQGLILEWPTYDEQCPTPWDGENTVLDPELTDGWGR